MALTKELVASEIERKKQLAQKQRVQRAAELDSITKEIQNAEYELSVVKDKLNAATEALYDKNAELNARKQAFESANRAIYNDLAASEAQVAGMLSQRESVLSTRNELKTEVNNIIADMNDVLSIYAANHAHLLDTWRKSTTQSIKVNDKQELATILQMNPGTIVNIIDADGELHTIDNRNKAAYIQNDSLNTEKEGLVTPFRFIKPLKTVKSNRGNVITSLDSLSETLSNFTRWAEQIPKGVTIEPSYGGVRLQIHKVGPKVTCWDDNRINHSDKLPTIVSTAGLIPHDFVIDGFLEVEAGAKALKKSEIIGMLLNNDTLLEQKSRFIVTDVMWLDNIDCHAESLDSRIGRLNVFNNKYKHIVSGKSVKVYTKQDTLDCISQMCQTPNASGAIMKHPDYTYGLGGTTTMAVEFEAKKTLNVKIIYATTVSPGQDEYIYDCAVVDGLGNEFYVGKTDITTFTPDVQALKVEFRAINEFIDPATDVPHFNMIGAKVIDAVTLDEISTIEETKGFADMDETPVRYRAVPELGIMFSNPELKAFEEIEMDCACRKKPVAEEPTIDVEFKVKEQMYKVVNDGIEHTRPVYHLLIQLPTKILDFTSTMNPLTQQPCTMERATATKMHWEVAGELSPRHKLNDGKNQKSIIATIDQGHARITTDGDLNYLMNLYLKGDYINGMFEMARQGYNSEAWTFNSIGSIRSN